VADGAADVSVAVVGAGLAGMRTCEALRQHGYTEPIVLIGAESHAPYSRPPLSKEVLRGDDPSVATLRQADEFGALDVDVRLGRVALALDVEARRLRLDDGTELTADDIVIATGAAPRRLPGAALDGMHTLRTVDDCLALRAALTEGARVVVVGAGFIGLEVAASARTLGCAVTVVDVLPAPLSRVLPAGVGTAVTRLHAANGVDVRCGVGVADVRGSGAVDHVVLDDGTSLAADVVVVGIGVVPETSWLIGSGLTINDGVECDEALRAAPGIWAIGDIARWRQPTGGTARLEHWTNATEQPQAVARNIIAGTSEPFRTVPYFWSDQYDAKLQCLGFTSAADQMQVVVGAIDEPKWVALLRSGDRLSGVVGLRSPGRVMKLRALLAAESSWDDALAAVG
jgi:NADPH-dependent 2,4-dienoyl-CoA reductase/sulfur reductase-like enzyme